LKNYILFISISSCLFLRAQDPVKWVIGFEKEQSEIILLATIESGWHIYSQDVHPSAGPVPTDFTFITTQGIKVKGKTIEPTPIEHYDPNFEADLLLFEKEVRFSQSVKVKKKGTIKGSIVYMVCNETMCLPPVDIPFELKIEK
jgi:thiol:disulfide interchange protein DsbD